MDPNPSYHHPWELEPQSLALFDRSIDPCCEARSQYRCILLRRVNNYWRLDRIPFTIHLRLRHLQSLFQIERSPDSIADISFMAQLFVFPRECHCMERTII